MAWGEEVVGTAWEQVRIHENRKGDSWEEEGGMGILRAGPGAWGASGGRRTDDDGAVVVGSEGRSHMEVVEERTDDLEVVDNDRPWGSHRMSCYRTKSPEGDHQVLTSWEAPLALRRIPSRSSHL
jgi:hypothetical protein